MSLACASYAWTNQGKVFMGGVRRGCFTVAACMDDCTSLLFSFPRGQKSQPFDKGGGLPGVYPWNRRWSDLHAGRSGSGGRMD